MSDILLHIKNAYDFLGYIQSMSRKLYTYNLQEIYNIINLIIVFFATRYAAIGTKYIQMA